MSKKIVSLPPAQAVLEYVRSLTEDDVIDNTFRLMGQLRAGLDQIDVGELTREEKDALAEGLLKLHSECLAGGLHRGEIPVTNGVIQAKNAVLSALGVEIPDSHQPLDPSKYTYSW